MHLFPHLLGQHLCPDVHSLSVLQLLFLIEQKPSLLSIGQTVIGFIHTFPQPLEH